MDRNTLLVKSNSRAYGKYRDLEARIMSAGKKGILKGDELALFNLIKQHYILESQLLDYVSIIYDEMGLGYLVQLEKIRKGLFKGCATDKYDHYFLVYVPPIIQEECHQKIQEWKESVLHVYRECNIYRDKQKSSLLY